MTDGKRLIRSESDRMVAGVAGGLAQYLNIDPALVRIGFVLLAVFGGSGLIIYLAMWLIVPTESRVSGNPRDAVREGATEMRESAEKLAGEVRGSFGRKGDDSSRETEEPSEEGPGDEGDTTP